MPTIKSFNEIIASMLDRLRLTQPNLDTKPGTVSRDLFVDLQADELQKVYRLISIVSEKQSFLTSSGRDLDRLAANFGLTRKLGSQASGTVVFTSNNLDNEITIPDGTIVSSKNGTSFNTIGTYIMSPADKSRLSANTFRLRDGLSTAGITDKYSIEVPVQATSPGSSSNLSSYQVIETSSEFSINVTNIGSFSGGSDLEADGSFRSRIVSVFSGANIGTSSGYKSAADGITGVLDSMVVEPGSSLMLRDGSEVLELDDGNFKIVDSGTGGKVDIYILGRQLEEISQSFIFSDFTDGKNISDDKNDLILGNSVFEDDLTSEEKRYLAFKNGEIPKQPVDSINSITGSTSGLLSEAIVDENGIYIGNYILNKDSNPSTGGSPFGLDKIKFINNYKNVEREAVNKSSLNSTENLSFSNINSINNIYQDLLISGENSKVSDADNSIIKLSHSPVSQVSQILNVTTGEIYFIEQDNFSEGINNSGEIKISGKSLPRKNDKLKSDYTWRLKFDKYLDYNPGKYSFFKGELNQEQVSWHNSNGIYAEESVLLRDSSEEDFYLNTEYNITEVESVYYKSLVSIDVKKDIQGAFYAELSLSEKAIDNIISIKNSEGQEVFSTPNNDGSFKNRKITFPSDAVLYEEEPLSVEYNKVDIYNLENYQGKFSLNRISLPSNEELENSEIFSDIEGLYLSDATIYVDYVASIKVLVPNQSLTTLPISSQSNSNSLFGQDLNTISDSKNLIEFKFNSEGEISNIKRFGPSRIKLIISGTSTSGTINVRGQTITKLDLDFDASGVFDGVSLDMSSVLSGILPNYLDYRLIKATDFYVDETLVDLYGYQISESLYDEGIAIENSSMSNYTLDIPNTTLNSKVSFSSGSKCKITIYLLNSNDSEELFYFQDESRITDKIFSRIDKISISSGFKNNLGQPIGDISILSLSQPEDNDIYYIDYFFKAPQNGEKLIVKYNTNKLIHDVTLGLEAVRPITADILVKEAYSQSIDVHGDIVIDSDLLEESESILENVAGAITNLLNTNELGGIIDYSDVLNVGTSISGVESMNIKIFNTSGNVGRKSFIKALDNQTLSAGKVEITVVDRRRLRVY